MQQIVKIKYPNFSLFNSIENVDNFLIAQINKCYESINSIRLTIIISDGEVYYFLVDQRYFILDVK